MDDSILGKLNVFYFISMLLFLYVAVSFIRKVNPFNNEKIICSNVYKKIFVQVILPIVFILSAVWFSGRPFLDYIVKDYQVKIITINYKSSSVKSFEGEVNTEEDGTFYINKKSLKYFYEGEKYEIVFGKRSKVIIEYTKLE